MFFHTVCYLQAEVGEQEGSSLDSVQRTRHMPAGEGPVQTDGQSAPGAAPGPQEEVQRAHCKSTLRPQDAFLLM